MKKLNSLTVVIVTYLTKKNILLNCLKSIDKNVKIIIVENSSKFNDKKFFLKKFLNLKILCTGTNLGYGGGNNFGLLNVTTQYALILNPDIICDIDFFKNLNKLLNDNKILKQTEKNKQITKILRAFRETDDVIVPMDKTNSIQIIKKKKDM